MLFEKLVTIFEQLESISSGNDMRAILSEFFTQIEKKEISTTTYLILGKLGAEYESNVLGIAEQNVIKAISKAAGVSVKKVKEIAHKHGDIGLAAQELCKSKTQTLIPITKLTTNDLYGTLNKISTISGSGSNDTKTNLIVSLLQRTSSTGAKYICRITLGTLRLGVADMTVIDSLSIAFTGEKSNKKLIEHAYNLCPDVGLIAEIMATKGLKGLEKINVKVGRPIKMMLAQRVNDLEEIKKKIEGDLVIEGKYDGERIQAHKTKDGTINLFSRRLDNNTSQFPDLVDHLTSGIKAKEFILEGEILAIDQEGNHLPFQTLMQRRRKHNVQEYIKKIPVMLKVFDILYLDGKELMSAPLTDRVNAITKVVKESKNLKIAEKITSSKVEKVEEFFTQMLQEGYEGIIIKDPNGTYQAGTRGWNWIKWKKEYVEALTDTIDVVVIGGFYGKGRRSGVFGALLCAIYDTKKDQFVSFCKLGTGFTDDTLQKLHTTLVPLISKKKPARAKVQNEMIPDVWFTPELVVEISGAEITKSPFHTAGIALRFPRYLRTREKKAEQATTLDEVRKMQ